MCHYGVKEYTDVDYFERQQDDTDECFVHPSLSNGGKVVREVV